MYLKKAFVVLASLALGLENATAFTSQGASPPSTSLFALSRRAWLDASMSAACALVATGPAFADDAVDDLAMPSEEEEKAAAVSARVRN